MANNFTRFSQLTRLEISVSTLRQNLLSSSEAVKGEYKEIINVCITCFSLRFMDYFMF